MPERRPGARRGPPRGEAPSASSRAAARRDKRDVPEHASDGTDEGKPTTPKASARKRPAKDADEGKPTTPKASARKRPAKNADEGKPTAPKPSARKRPARKATAEDPLAATTGYQPSVAAEERPAAMPAKRERAPRPKKPRKAAGASKAPSKPTESVAPPRDLPATPAKKRRPKGSGATKDTVAAAVTVVVPPTTGTRPTRAVGRIFRAVRPSAGAAAAPPLVVPGRWAIPPPTAVALPAYRRAVAGVERRSVLGLAPLLSLVIASGLVVIGLADQLARGNSPLADELFWIGLLAAVLPCVARLASGRPSRPETIAIVLMLGVGLYLVKVLHSPGQFTFPDEFTHLRTTNDILTTQHLFAPNPLLPVSARFPGLEIVTTLVVQLTGLSVFDAGMVVAGAARVVLVMSLYFLFEAISRSRRISGLAAVVYMTNPNFLFFGAAFKYETMALAFAALALFLITLRSRAVTRQDRLALTVLAVMALGATVASHHMITYAVAGFLLVWAIVARFRRPGNRPMRTPAPRVMLLITLAISTVWLLLVAPATIGYLAPVLVGAIEAGVHLLGSRLGLIADGASGSRNLFETTAGVVPSPPWERIVAIGSVGVILLGLVVGAYRVVRYHRNSALTVTMLAIAAAYPVTLALRFTGRGWETSNRSSEILFVGIGLVVAIGFVSLRRLYARRLARTAVAVGAVGILLIGGVFAGWAYQWRLPWPYAVAEGPRAVELEGATTATWMLDRLGPDNRIGADDLNRQLLGSLGEQETMSTISGGINPMWVLGSPTLDADRITLLRDGAVEYLLVDHRLVARTDIFDSYFEEPDVAQALAKFDGVAGVSRVYDSGDIRIYDVRGLSGAP